MGSHTPTYRCQNCDWTTEDTADLCQIDDIFERVQPGDVMPDGECPECGGVCFEDEARPTLQERHDALLAALVGLLDYEDDEPAEGTFGAEVYAQARAAIRAARGE